MDRQLSPYFALITDHFEKLTEGCPNCHYHEMSEVIVSDDYHSHSDFYCIRCDRHLGSEY